MMKGILLVGAVLSAGIAACGGISGSSDFGGPGGANGDGALGGGDGGASGLFGDGGGPGGGVTNACATDHAAAGLAPSSLVFIMDRSDSMSQQSKWPSCSAALRTFFSDPTTQGLNASLTWLPYVAPNQRSTGSNPVFSCNAADYTTPAIPMTTLPNASFASLIQAQQLQFGTPTLPALEGSATYAAQVGGSGAKVAIVLATDGLPYGCTGNTAQTVGAAAAQLAQKGILTYVIGVGTATGNLDAIAQGGGTNKPFLVPTSNPQQTEQAFLAAIKTIQGTLGCSYAIPAPSGGQTINYGEVNVVFTPAGGQPTTLTYSADCSNPDGWHYDNPQSPTQIDLCTQSCGTAKADQGAKMDIVFGCATNGKAQ